MQRHRLSATAIKTMLLAVRASVVTASGVNLKTLVDVLGRAGVQDVSVFANAIGDAFLFEPRPDFVIGVLSPVARDPQQGLTNLDVMLRIGRAVQQELPTLLIIPPPLLNVSPMAGVAVAYCPIDHETALTLHISAIIATAASQRDEVPKEPLPPKKSGLTSVIRYLASGPDLSTYDFEQLIIAVLESDPGARALISQVRDADDRGVDFVMAPTEAPSSIVLIEAKTGPVTERSLSRWENQLHNWVANRNASLGLLIYYDPEGTEFPARSSSDSPLVVSISLKSLAEELRSQTLPQVLNKAAAKAVGGTTP